MIDKILKFFGYEIVECNECCHKTVSKITHHKNIYSENDVDSSSKSLTSNLKIKIIDKTTQEK